jgi:hypothetical protein
MKKSVALVALPAGVVTETLPDPVLVGTFIDIAVDVAELAAARVTLNEIRSLLAAVSKLVPLILTAVPAVAIAEENPVIVGAPVALVTVKAELLVVEPAGEVTAIGPVVAPAGTVVTS